jgi:hypothetical protein
MPKNPEFLILWIRDSVRIGGSIKVVGVAATEAEAESKLKELDSTTTGRVAIAEIKKVFDRQPTIESVPVDARLVDAG